MPFWRRSRRADDVISRQQAMNRQTWEQLKTHGVDEGTPLRLEFFYEAPSRSGADELAEFLRRERSYEVQAGPDMVTGWTQPMSVTLEVLDTWVEWMVRAGDERGRCEFDGWGAQVP